MRRTERTNGGESMKRRRFLRLLVLLLAALALFLWDGQTRIVTDRYEVAPAGLPQSFDGFRIIQVSDLHGASFGEGNARLIERVRREKPDLIAITGDLVGKESDLAVSASLLPKLAEIAPCYYVNGNHEWASHTIDALEKQLEESGVTNLRNESVELERDGERVILLGVVDPNAWSHFAKPDTVVERLRQRYHNECMILLAHRNTWTEKYPELDVELILCGHGHGGIVRIPGIGGLYANDHSLFPGNTEGAIETEQYTMVVSRGLGNVHRVPRIFNNPELVTVILRAS